MYNTTEAENIFPYSIPETWQWTTLEKIAKWGSGGTPSRKISEYYQGNIAWLKTGELNNNYIFKTEEHITIEAVKNSSAKIFPKNSIVIAMYGATIGKVGILGIESSMNQACACAVCNENIYFKFLFHYLISQKENFVVKAKGGAQPNISQEIIKKFPIPLPPLDEQERIVTLLDKIFSKLDAAKKIVQDIVAGYELRRSAILHKAFTGELSAKFRAENNLSLDDWQTKKLGNLLTKIQYGYTAKAEKNNSLPKMLRITDIQNGFVNWETVPNCKIDDNQKEKYLLKDNDIVIARTGATTGKSYILKNSPISVFASYLVRLQTSEQIKSEFLYQFLQSDFYWNQISDFSSGIAQPGVNATKLKNILIPLPPLAEQKEIVRVLDSLLVKEQRTKEIAENILQEIDLLKKSILARAFRGEL